MSACPHRHGRARRGPGRAVFLDRDGVLIEDTGYPDDPEALALLPGVGEGLRRLQAAGWALVGVTNQSGVARGRFDLARLAEVHDRLLALLAGEGVTLNALYFCPHHLQGRPPWNTECPHRKPGPGMLLTAAAELGLDLPVCWLVGDREADVQAAHAAACRAICVGGDESAAEGRAADLAEAAAAILAAEGSRAGAGN